MSYTVSGQLDGLDVAIPRADGTLQSFDGVIDDVRYELNYFDGTGRVYLVQPDGTEVLLTDQVETLVREYGDKADGTYIKDTEYVLQFTTDSTVDLGVRQLPLDGAADVMVVRWGSEQLRVGHIVEFGQYQFAPADNFFKTIGHIDEFEDIYHQGVEGIQRKNNSGHGIGKAYDVNGDGVMESTGLEVTDSDFQRVSQAHLFGLDDHQHDNRINARVKISRYRDEW